jgi:hypothetical protein
VLQLLVHSTAAPVRFISLQSEFVSGVVTKVVTGWEEKLAQDEKT